ncbi:hypothetical protein EYF80_060427 [Liparis tanakae]|uniref:Uncharacterized protein n=1 Tax=Liparis tanakae TaxID=230148 RepID=A0A4Z2ELV9_9TELE|nr:hypothetical protein EYF80_060427 [Liparis tanakae]
MADADVYFVQIIRGDETRGSGRYCSSCGAKPPFPGRLPCQEGGLKRAATTTATGEEEEEEEEKTQL